jgi:hypothetical protein
MERPEDVTKSLRPLKISVLQVAEKCEQGNGQVKLSTHGHMFTIREQNLINVIRPIIIIVSIRSCLSNSQRRNR